eukprot:3326125-Rhodomonas_salina.3
MQGPGGGGRFESVDVPSQNDDVNDYITQGALNTAIGFLGIMCFLMWLPIPGICTEIIIPTTCTHSNALRWWIFAQNMFALGGIVYYVYVMFSWTGLRRETRPPQASNASDMRNGMQYALPRNANQRYDDDDDYYTDGDNGGYYNDSDRSSARRSRYGPGR